jgi:hypothetical protein
MGWRAFITGSAGGNDAIAEGAAPTIGSLRRQRRQPDAGLLQGPTQFESSLLDQPITPLTRLSPLVDQVGDGPW